MTSYDKLNLREYNTNRPTLMENSREIFFRRRENDPRGKNRNVERNGKGKYKGYFK